MSLDITAAQQAIFNAFDVALDHALGAGIEVGVVQIEPPLPIYPIDSKMARPPNVTAAQNRAIARATFRQSLAATLVSAIPSKTYTDTSGTPGNATANSDLGRSAIVNAQSSVVITNSKVGTTSLVLISPETNEALTFSTVVSNGFFTVNLSSVTSGSYIFRWAVQN